MIVAGIDPGLSGAIGLLGRDIAPHVAAMPTAPYSKTGFVKRIVNFDHLARILDFYALDHVFLEKVQAFPGQGVGSMFSLGMSYGGAMAVAQTLDIEVHLVTPQEWKKHFGLSADKQLSLDLARSLFPNVDLSRKKDDGKAEALLIAKYGLEMLDARKCQ